MLGSYDHFQCKVGAECNEDNARERQPLPTTACTVWNDQETSAKECFRKIEECKCGRGLGHFWWMTSTLLALLCNLRAMFALDG